MSQVPTQSGIGVRPRSSSGTPTPPQPLLDRDAPRLPTPGPNTRRSQLIDQINQLAGHAANATRTGLQTAGIERRLSEQEQHATEEQQYGEAVNFLEPRLPTLLSAAMRGELAPEEGEDIPSAVERMIRAEAEGLAEPVAQRLVGRYGGRIAGAIQGRVDQVRNEQMADSLIAIRGSLLGSEPDEMGERLRRSTEPLDTPEGVVDSVVLVPMLHTLAERGVDGRAQFESVAAMLQDRHPEEVATQRNELEANERRQRSAQRAAAEREIANAIDSAALGKADLGQHSTFAEALDMVAVYQQAGVLDDTHAEAMRNTIAQARARTHQASEIRLQEQQIGSAIREGFTAASLRGASPVPLGKLAGRTVEVEVGDGTVAYEVKAEDVDAEINWAASQMESRDQLTQWAIEQQVPVVPALKSRLTTTLQGIDVDNQTVDRSVLESFGGWRDLATGNRDFGNAHVTDQQRHVYHLADVLLRHSVASDDPARDATTALLRAKSTIDNRNDRAMVGAKAIADAMPSQFKKLHDKEGIAAIARGVAQVFATADNYNDELAAEAAWELIADDYIITDRFASRASGALSSTARTLLEDDKLARYALAKFIEQEQGEGRDANYRAERLTLRRRPTSAVWQIVERRSGLPIEGSPAYLDAELSDLANEYLIDSSKMGTFATSSMPASERALRRAAGPLYQGVQGVGAVVESSGALETAGLLVGVPAAQGVAAVVEGSAGALDAAGLLGGVLGGQITHRIRGLQGEAIEALGLFGPMRTGGAQ